MSTLDGRTHSRMSSAISENLERVMRNIRHNSNKLKRHIEHVEKLQEGFKPDLRLVAEGILDSMRLLGVTAGYLSDIDLNSLLHPSDLSIIFERVFDDVKKLAVFLQKSLTECEGRSRLCQIDWLRIASSAELAIPRIFIVTSIGLAYLSFSIDQFKEVFPSSFGEETIKNINKKKIQNQKDIFQLISSEYFGNCNSITSLLSRTLLQEIFITFAKQFWTEDEQVNFWLDQFSIANRSLVRHSFLPRISSDLKDIQRRELIPHVISPIKQISQLEFINISLYKERILPFILGHLVACQDFLAQQLIFKEILSLFPSTYHVSSFGELFEAVNKFSPLVNINELLSAIVDCILISPEEGSNVNDEGVYSFLDQITDCILETIKSTRNSNRSEKSSLQSTLSILNALIKRSLEYPLNIKQIDRTLDFVNHFINEIKDHEECNLDLCLGRIFDTLLTEQSYRAGFISSLNNLVPLLHHIGPQSASTIATALIERLAKEKFNIGNDPVLFEKVKSVYLIISTGPLLNIL